MNGVQQPSLWDFKLIPNVGIRPSLSPRHLQNVSVIFVLKRCEVLNVITLAIFSTSVPKISFSTISEPGTGYNYPGLTSVRGRWEYTGSQDL